MSTVLGINCSGYLSSACLVMDGRIRHAITEERLSRVKRDKSFPHRALRYCCDAAGISVDDVTDIFIGWNPGYYFHRSDHMLHEAMQNRGKMSYLTLNELAQIQGDNVRRIRQEIESCHGNWRLHFVDHHKAHLANGFLQSGFEQADFLILDGFGEVAAGIAGTATQDGIDILATNRSPHSLGLFYSTFTQFLGFAPNGDEWKVMALASLGDPTVYYDAIRSMVRVETLTYEIDLSYFENFLYFTPHYFSPKLVELLGPPLARGTEPGQRECDIVAAVQRVVEETIFDLLANLQRKTGNTALVVGGGSFMNSVANGKICSMTPYEALFIGGSPDDSGIGSGSALYGSHYELGQQVVPKEARANAFGRSYSNREIERELQRRKLRYRQVEEPARVAAEQLRERKIVGWFQGPSEFGQRALGNRSILADPTDPAIKDLVNATIKYREPYRPFAPAVLAERQDEIFEVPGDQRAYFMERVFPFREAWRERVPAVVHFDGSGRLQSVEREINPLYHELIVRFEALSGVPVILNTSFNVSGMPLVETPGDAINCFYQSGLDTLIMHNFIVEK